MTAVSGAVPAAAPPSAPPRKRPAVGGEARAGAAHAPSTDPAIPESSAPAEPSDDRNLLADREAALQARRSAALLKEQQRFNFFAMEHAELARERQVIADLFAAQNKHSDDELKDWIRSI